MGLSPRRDLCVFRVKTVGRTAGPVSGLDLPPMGRATSTAIALGPGDWLLIAPEGRRTALSEQLAAASAAYAVDVSDALVFLLANIDPATVTRLTGLDAARFGRGYAATTRLAGVPVTFTTGDDDRLQIILDVSNARHLRSYLESAL